MTNNSYLTTIFLFFFWAPKLVSLRWVKCTSQMFKLPKRHWWNLIRIFDTWAAPQKWFCDFGADPTKTSTLVHEKGSSQVHWRNMMYKFDGFWGLQSKDFSSNRYALERHSNYLRVFLEKTSTNRDGYWRLQKDSLC